MGREKLWWERQFKDQKKRSVVKLETIDGKFNMKIIIPSDYYPLNGRHKVFTSMNTEIVLNKEILKLFDKVKYKNGHCYQNTLELCKILQEQGYPARPFVGWLFTNGVETPLHHCWCVLGDSVLDLSDDFTLMLYGENGEHFKNAKSQEELRNLVVDFHACAIEEHVPNHIRCQNVGQPTPFLLYVGSECNPLQGREIFQKLMQKYPEHECAENCDEDGYSPTQKLMQKRGVID